MLWDYQRDIAKQAAGILKRLHIVYLAMEKRVGKTLTAFETIRLIGKKNVFFVTKKKAIPSILKDYQTGGYTAYFKLTVVNYEQVHKYNPEGYDVVVVDEAHSLGAFPRPALRTQRLKRFVGSKDLILILMSGSPTPESFSQIYHQFWISNWSPFSEANFYKWAKIYVNIRERIIGGHRVRDYSDANKKLVMPFVEPYMITFTQEEAGFRFCQLEDIVLTVPMKPIIYQVKEKLLRKRYVRFSNGSEIVADTAAKLLTKIHQICSGTVICEDGKRLILDDTKAKFIREYFYGQKIAIYYKFQAEMDVLRRYFPNHTVDPIEFARNSDLVFLSQIQSGSMGIDLSIADALVFYNIDYSFTHYWQARNRIQHRFRESNPKIYWIFSKGGIEHKILNIVRKKRDYTTYYFKKDFFVKQKDNVNA